MLSETTIRSPSPTSMASRIDRTVTGSEIGGNACDSKPEQSVHCSRNRRIRRTGLRAAPRAGLTARPDWSITMAQYIIPQSQHDGSQYPPPEHSPPPPPPQPPPPPPPPGSAQ